MNPLVIHLSVKLGLLAVLAGVIARGRFGECRAFPVYVLVVLICETAVFLDPERFFVWNVYVRMQWLYDVCKLAVAVELATRAFRAFPGARPSARLGFVAILALSTISVIAATPDRALTPIQTYEALLHTVEPRIVNGIIWLFVVTSRLVLFYNLPWSDWHRAISLGFAAYLVVFVTCMNIAGSLGWQARDVINRIDGTAYLALTLWWAWAAWRKDDVPATPAGVLPGELRAA